MDIGAEISKKIQMAITAKLKELDAYVDDELPDYIMIMVANRKTESQMTEALSLFLSENTKAFTTWLHSLLTTLRKTKSDKKDDATASRKNSLEGSKRGEIKEPKTSENDLRQDRNKSEPNPIEPVITINPECDDILDKELQTDVPTSGLFQQHSDQYNILPPPKNIAVFKPSVSKGNSDRKNIGKSASKIQRKVSKDRSQEQKPTEERPRYDAHAMGPEKAYSKTSGKSRRSSTKNQSESSSGSSDVKQYDKRELGEESNLALKRKRISAEKSSKTSFEVDDDTSENPKGSLSSTISQVSQTSAFVSDSDSDDTLTKHKVSSKVAYPKRKMRVPLNKQANRALLMRAVSEAEKSIRKRGKLSENKLKGRIGEKPKLVPAAGKQPKDGHIRTVGEKDGARQFAQDSHARAVGVKDGGRQSAQRGSKFRVKSDAYVEGQGQSMVVAFTRDSKVPRTSERSTKEAPDKVILSDKRNPILSVSDNDQDANKTIPSSRKSAAKRKMQPVVCDERKFVIQKEDEETIESNVSPAVKFDSRKSKRQSDSASDETYGLGKKQRMTARISPRPHMPDQKPPTPENVNKSISAVSPMFIVTLDGVVSSKQSISSSMGGMKESDFIKPKFEPVTGPPSQVLVQPTKQPTGHPSQVLVQPTKQPLVLTKPQKPVVIQVADVEDDHVMLKHSTSVELEKMKRKISEVREEAVKLKKMQAKLAAVQAKQYPTSKDLDTEESSPQAEQRSIYICNVHFSISEKQLSDYFSICGKVTRVTIIKDLYTGQPKGFAYLEFEDKRSVASALALDNTRLSNRIIRVTLKQGKPIAPFLSTRGRYLPRRSMFPVRGIRGHRLTRNLRGYTSSGAHKLTTRNKTWINPSLSKK